MVNKQYQIGRLAEYRAKKELEKQDYYVERSAGSKGVADLICWDINQFRLIQVKSAKKFTGWIPFLSKREIKEFEGIPTPMNCRKELWVWVSESRKWKKKILMGFG